MKPVLTEDGTAIAMQDGWPVIETGEGQRVPWDIAKQANALADANKEAAERRKALEQIVPHLGIEVDVRSPKGLETLITKISEIPTVMEELGSLRRLKEAGELGEDAEAKIQAAAEKLKKDEMEGLQVKLAMAEKAKGDAEAQAARDALALRSAETRRALIAFHQRYDKFEKGSLQSFLRAASETTPDGYRWIPTGRYDEETGDPQIVLATEDGQVLKGPDNIEAMTPAQWAEARLQKSDPILFRKPGGTGNDWDPSDGTYNGDMSKLPVNDLAALARSRIPAR
jgi:hypothetical protein